MYTKSPLTARLLAKPGMFRNDSAVGENDRIVPAVAALRLPRFAVTVHGPVCPAKTMPGVAPKLQRLRSLET